MFEGLVTNLLNHYLGRYIQNLQTENINIGILNGVVELTNLQLRPEALFELDLPIEVQAGYVGKIKLDIPFTSIYTSPVIAVLEDVYVLASPLAETKYDAAKEKALLNAIKRKKLEDLEAVGKDTDDDNDPGFVDKLLATIINNIQVTIQRIHVRYEDRVTNPEHPFGCGVMLERLSAQTTNGQWKVTHIDSNADSVQKLIRMHRLSAYWNPYLPEQNLVRSKLNTSAWRNLLQNSINTHRIMEEDFDFILRPTSAEAKLVVNKSDNANLPKLLADFIMTDIDLMVSRQQFLNVLSLWDSLKMMAVNQRYRKYSPGVPFKGHIKAWWKYSYNAVVEEYIRPYSWERIHKHRMKYRQYKNVYKKLLEFPDGTNINIKEQCTRLEEELDVANILMAREHAKLEFAREAPERAARKKKARPWYKWFWSSEDSEDEDIVVMEPGNRKSWFDMLTSDEKQKLYQGIGYDENKNIYYDSHYVAHKLSLNLASCTMTLVNYGKEVLKVMVSNVMTIVEHRPKNSGFKVIVMLRPGICTNDRLATRTESFVVEGVSIEHDLVPIITSDIGVFAPSPETQVFRFEFETNPANLPAADFAVKLNVQPVEIVYDAHSVTEVLAFFHVSHMDVAEVKSAASAHLGKMMQFSRAGLQYAIDQHKTVHLSVNMRSPYIVIPEHGTLHRSKKRADQPSKARGGNVLVVDFGKLKVESELQPKNVSLEDATMSEIESRLYDKFNVTVTEVKALIADSGDDWHTAQTRPESEYHILPSVGMQLSLFNSVQPGYKKLPQQKLVANLPTLKLNVSDEKIVMLSDFFHNIPMPHSTSMLGIDDCVDGYAEPQLGVPVMDLKHVQVEPSVNQLKKMKRAVHTNSIRRSQGAVIDKALSNKRTSKRDSVDYYYSASDHSDEDIAEWARALDIPSVDDHTSKTNHVKILLRFMLGEVVIHLSKYSDRIETQYLMFRVDRLCADTAITTYGLALQASLGGIQMVDKIHTGSSGQYLEILSSKSKTDLISVVYRKVDPSCPDFEEVYCNREQGIIIGFSSLNVVFDRLAVLYLHQFTQGLLQSTSSLTGLTTSDMRKSTSTVLSPLNVEQPGETASLTSMFMAQVDQGKSYGTSATKLLLVAKMDDLYIKLCNHETDFANVTIKGLESRVMMKARRTTIHAKLRDLSIEDLTDLSLYPKMLTIEDDKVFDMKLVLYNKPSQKKSSRSDLPPVESSLRVRIGKLHYVFLYKFLAELSNFTEPFINPELTESYRTAAQAAMHNKLQDVQEQGTFIKLDFDIRTPTILMPQNSGNPNLLIFSLGNLALRNYYESTEIRSGVTQKWDHITVQLDSVKVDRAIQSPNDNLEQMHTIVEPISFWMDLKRALPPVSEDLGYDISGTLHTVKVSIGQDDLRVVLATLRENMMEQTSSIDKIDLTDLGPLPSRLIVPTQESLDTTTPVVEIEEPLLSAPETAEILKKTKFSCVMQGMELILLEGDVNKSPSLSPGDHEGEGVSRFEMGNINIEGMLNNDSSLEVKIQLKSVLLEDIRERSNLAVKRMIQSSLVTPDPNKLPPAMVDFTYKYSKEGNQHIDINVETMRVNVCVPYLLMVLNIFVGAMPGYEESPDDIAPPAPSDGLPSQDTGSPQDKNGGSTLTVSGRFKHPEIVLFAEPTLRYSRVLVLKTNCVMDYFSHLNRQRLEAKVKQLQIVSCVYGQKNQITSMVLFPCDLEFTGSVESPESGWEMEAKISDINLHLSPTTIHICLDVKEMINKDGRMNKKKDETDNVPEPQSTTDLWATKRITAERWLQPEDEVQNDQFPLYTKAPPSETLNVDLKKVQVMFEVENRDHHIPRLCLKTGLQATIQDWSKQLRLSAELQLECSYYNEKLAVWEPLIEPVFEGENKLRAWEVLVKMVQASSHPIACSQRDLTLDRGDEIDGEVHYLMCRARAKSDSSETDTDSETEMTVIRPKGSPRMRLGSDRSYDSVSHHGSVQGESDSEPEGLIDTLSNNLDSIFSSDSSDADTSEVEDDAFEHPDKPVFLTARGPVHVDADVGRDDIDGEEEEEETGPLCTYLLVDSRDQMLFNLTPQAMEVMTEVVDTLTKSPCLTLKSVTDLPGFEMYNQLDVAMEVSLSSEQKVQTFDVVDHLSLRRKYDMPDPSQAYKENLHNVTVVGQPCAAGGDEVDAPEAPEEEDSDHDDLDGLSFLNKTLASAAFSLTSATAFVFEPETEEHKHERRKTLDQDKMHVKVRGFEEICNLSHQKATHKLLALSPCRNDTNYCVVYDVDVTHGRKIVTIRSPLQVKNHLTVPVEVYCRTVELQKYQELSAGPDRDGFTLLKVLEADQTYDVPLYVAYHCKLYIAPAQLKYALTANPLWWQDLSVAKEKSRFFNCLPKENNQNPFYFKVVCKEGAASRGSSLPKVVPHYSMHLYPPVVIHNFLPYDLQFSLEGSALSSLIHGESMPLYTADLTHAPRLLIQVTEYVGLDWTGSLELTSELEEFKAINMDPGSNVDGGNKQLSLSIHINRSCSMDLHIYSPYWIINKTGLPVQIRGSRSDAVFENDMSADPMLFRYKKHRRKKAKLRVYNSKWTHSFSMDTVGSNGIVICNDKERNRKYQFLLQIQMSKLKLTKIVTIMPYFLVVNNTDNNLRYMEENEQADLWLDIAPHECAPFWPVTDTLRMYVKHQNSNVSSQHFSIRQPHATTLRMDAGSALCVEVAGGTENSMTITFLPYEHGDAPVRIENLCEDVFIKMHQKNQSQVSLLAPNQSVLYTWDDPTVERTLLWNVYNRKKPSYPVFLTKDGYGEVPLSIQTVRRSSVLIKDKPDVAVESSEDDDSDAEQPLLTGSYSMLRGTRTDKVTVYWVSYLDGLQRAILFTQDERVAKRARKANEIEKASLAVFLSIGGIGVSLINGLYEEVAFMSLNGAPAVWEVERRNKWKMLYPVELASLLEEKWRNGVHRVYLENYAEADLHKMEMKKPFIGALRRTYQPALWLEYRQSIHHTYVHAKIHRLQVDNQLTDAYFPTVLYPSPIPRYIVKRTGTKPFIELAMMRRQVPENNIDTFKYLQVLVQEFNLRIDKGFLLSTLNIFSNQWKQEHESKQLQADLALVHKSLREVAAVQAASRPQRIVFEHLHLSPLKLHISFSLDGVVHRASQPKDTSITSDIVDFFLSSVGATFTDIKEVELRMAFFERQGAMLTMSQLLSQVQAHYTSQAIQQAYVLILGLDVLGNPYGLIKDFTQGLGDFFYEPFLGSIQGPDKFGENFVHGIQSLMGHTIGGLAGSVALVTGSLGKALATLSFDKNYKMKRQQRMRQANNLPESLYLAGKGFVMGVALGLSGVVVKPIKGAYEEGAEGFFRGMGKGLMGLITKPTGGVVDMVSLAFDGIRRSAEMGEDVVMRTRLPRYIHPQVGLRPYSQYQAVGMRLLNNLSKGKYVHTDKYWAHAALSQEERADVTVVTDRRILLLEKCRFWGDWDVEWDIPLDDIIGTPAITDNKIVFKVRKDDTGFSIFTSDQHEIVCQDPEVLQWIQAKIEKVVVLESQ